MSTVLPVSDTPSMRLTIWFLRVLKRISYPLYWAALAGVSLIVFILLCWFTCAHHFLEKKGFNFVCMTTTHRLQKGRES